MSKDRCRAAMPWPRSGASQAPCQSRAAAWLEGFKAAGFGAGGPPRSRRSSPHSPAARDEGRRPCKARKRPASLSLRAMARNGPPACSIGLVASRTARSSQGWSDAAIAAPAGHARPAHLGCLRDALLSLPKSGKPDWVGRGPATHTVRRSPRPCHRARSSALSAAMRSGNCNRTPSLVEGRP